MHARVVAIWNGGITVFRTYREGIIGVYLLAAGVACIIIYELVRVDPVVRVVIFHVGITLIFTAAGLMNKPGSRPEAEHYPYSDDYKQSYKDWQAKRLVQIGSFLLAGGYTIVIIVLSVGRGAVAPAFMPMLVP